MGRIPLSAAFMLNICKISDCDHVGLEGAIAEAISDPRPDPETDAIKRQLRGL